MSLNKNVIQLGLLNDITSLVSGKDIYYIYYKSNGDLYMYDSLKNIETNLFKLGRDNSGVEVPVHTGNIIINAIKKFKGCIKIFAGRFHVGHIKISASLIHRGTISITANKL
jgi:hypothetical protein